MTNISQRDIFWEKVYEMAKKDRNVIIVSADMGAPSLDKIRLELPTQFVNVGIAEQNAITLAAGLALSGKKVFVYAIAPFITLRCLEQIRVENAIMNIPITVVGVGVGFGYDDSGPTHHLIEDIAVMRSMPNITVNTMTDNYLVEAFAEASADIKNTSYIRLYRQNLPAVYKSKPDISKGHNIVKEGNDYFIVACGSTVYTALETSAKLQEKGINAGVIDLFSQPVNEEQFVKTVKRTKKILTLEEHFLPGGMGSAVLETLADNGISIPVKRLGLPTSKGYCYKYGGIDVIREFYGIDNDTVLKQSAEFFK